MSGVFGGGGDGGAREATAQARRQQQDANEDEMRARQRAERGGTRRGRNMLVGRLSRVMPKTLGGT